MVAYLKKNGNVEVGTHIQHERPFMWPILVKVSQRSRSHGHIMYTD